MAHTKRDGLYRRENGILAFRYKGPDGIWREKYTGTTDRQKARAFKAQFLEQVDQGALPNEMAKWPVPDALEYYLQNREALLAPRTWKAHRSRCNSLIRTIGKKRLDEIDNRAVDSYQASRRKSGVSAATVNKEVEILSYVLRKAKLWRRLEEDYHPLPISHRSPRRPLDVGDFATLVKAGLSNPDWEAALLAAVVAANTACRSWEIKSLRIADIDLSDSNPRLLVRRENTKSDAGAREIELNSLALWAIKRLIERAAQLGAVRPDHYLLPADLSRHAKSTDPLNGRRGYDPARHQQSWRTAWRKMTQAAGLSHVHFHDLRHTALTRGREQGVDIGILKAIEGPTAQLLAGTHAKALVHERWRQWTAHRQAHRPAPRASACGIPASRPLSAGSSPREAVQFRCGRHVHRSIVFGRVRKGVFKGGTGTASIAHWKRTA